MAAEACRTDFSLRLRALSILAPFLLLSSLLPAHALDVLHLKQGDPVPCEILELSDENIRIKVSIDVGGGKMAFSTKVLPMSAVKFIDFAPLAGEEYLLGNGTAEDVEDLETLWKAYRPNLHRPNSRAGETGLVLAGVLLESERATDRERAKELFITVEQRDWDEKRRLRARQGRLRTLIALGDVEAAVQEALAMAEESESAEILMDAKFVLATAEFDALKKLVEENPKWDEDDEVRPERNRMFHETIDKFLFPHLFHGSAENAAARGLWSAIEVYRWAGEAAEARARAGDLLALYPGTEYAGRARQMLEQAEAAPSPAPPKEDSTDNAKAEKETDENTTE